MFGENLN